MLARLNPFRSLPNPREVWAWGMYDLANQSFQLLINTLLFGLYVKNVVASDPAAGAALWGNMSAVSLALIVLLSPVFGALADVKAWKRELLLATGFVCAALTCALALVAPGQIALAFTLYLIAAVACGLGENFLGSFLPQIATPATMGRVSALGWSMSYVGALLLIAITALWLSLMDWTEPHQLRPTFVFAGLWFLAGMLPAVLFLRERARPLQSASAAAIMAAFARLYQSARESHKHPALARFFLVGGVYSMGTLAMIYFLGIIADNLGFAIPQMLLFALAMALASGVAAAFAARYQDRIGHRRAIRIFLALWVVGVLAMAWARWLDMPASLFWLVAVIIGLALGGIGTASRALVGVLTPEDRAGEYFGVWGMVYKLAGMLGVLAFGYVSAAFDDPLHGQIAALTMVAAFFAVGFIGMGWVKDARLHGRSGGEPAQDPGP